MKAKITTATAKGKTWKAEIFDGDKKVKTIQGGQKGTKLGGERTKTVYGIKSFNKGKILDLSSIPDRINPYLVVGILIATATLAFVFPIPTFIIIMLLAIIGA